MEDTSDINNASLSQKELDEHRFCLRAIENCRFSTETFWRLVFSHEWFIIHLQRDEVELEMNSEPRV